MLLDRGVPTRPNRLVAAYAKWVPNLNTRADLTFRCRAMMPASVHTERRVSLVLNDDLLNTTIVRALNRLNSYALGSCRSKVRPRLNALVWMERGEISGRPHAHALIERPGRVSPAEFSTMVERAWRAQPFGYDQMRIEEVRDIERSIGYNAKTSPGFSGNVVYFHKEPDESAWWRIR